MCLLVMTMERTGIAGDDALWESIARYIAGEAGTGEAEALERWLAGSPERRALVAALGDVTARLRVDSADVDAAAALRVLHERMDVLPLEGRETGTERVRASGRTSLLRIAATIAVLLIGGLIWRNTAGPEPATAPVLAAMSWSTPAGVTESVRLPDGTAVLLGPLSTLSLMEGYGSGTRAVRLSGEAMFEVAGAETGAPFTVHAGNGIVQDLGTAFTVRSVDSDEVRVVVTSGSVRFRAAESTGDAGVVLEAGDLGVLRGTVVRAEAAASRPAHLAWIEGRLVLEEAPFERVRTEVRRWHGIELRVDDPALATPPLTTTFEDASRQEVLDLLALVYGATIEQRGDTAILRGTANR